MADSDLRRLVQEEIGFDPRLDEQAIAVEADDGEVTLRGTVTSLRERIEATKAAKRVFGVKKVNNELAVRLREVDEREDHELRGAVLQALTLDARIPESVDASARDGFVTLTGTATHQYQRLAAEDVAANIPGVAAVEDEIALLAPPPDADDVRATISKALERSARIDANALQIEARGNTVTLSGFVGSWAEHDAAVAAAWAAPGVASVDDRLAVDF